MNLFAQSSNIPNQNVTPNDELAVFLFVLLFLLMVTIASYIARSIALAYIFKKAGQAAWKAWIPVYNQWLLLQLGGQAGWWSLVMLVPIANIAALVMMYIAMYQIGLKLQKPPAFVVLAVFALLGWYVWLAVDGSKWNDAAAKPRRDKLAKATVAQ